MIDQIVAAGLMLVLMVFLLWVILIQTSGFSLYGSL
jgi:hypothetical protein